MAKYITSETITKTERCPECGQHTLEVHLARELQQRPKHVWAMVSCNNPDCDYYNGEWRDE